MADEVVAYFDIRLTGCDPFSPSNYASDRCTALTIADTHGTIEVCGNEQFMLGRDVTW